MPQKIIMIVDQDADIAAMLGQVFTEAGYAVVTATPEALVAHTAPVADLIVLDMRPHSYDSLICAYLKTDPRTHRIPIIGLSTLTVAEVTGLGLYANAVFTKPFDIDTLTAAVHGLLGVPSRTMAHTGESQEGRGPYG